MKTFLLIIFIFVILLHMVALYDYTYSVTKKLYDWSKE